MSLDVICKRLDYLIIESFPGGVFPKVFEVVNFVPITKRMNCKNYKKQFVELLIEINFTSHQQNPQNEFINDFIVL